MSVNAAQRLQTLYTEFRGLLTASAAESRFDADFLHPVFGEGNPKSELLLIGEAPGAEEAAIGRPFVGKAGKQLDELLREAGILRENIYITNAVKYRPVTCSGRSVRNRTPSAGEVGDALPNLEREILLLAPKVIATLGNTPLRAVLRLACQPQETIGLCHGQARSICVDTHICTLFPLYHPASGIYQRPLIDVMRRDARLLGEQLVKQQ